MDYQSDDNSINSPPQQTNNSIINKISNFFSIFSHGNSSRQYRALFRKSATLQLRYRWTNFCIICVPVALIIFAGIMQLVVNAVEPDQKPTLVQTPPVPTNIMPLPYINQPLLFQKYYFSSPKRIENDIGYLTAEGDSKGLLGKIIQTPFAFHNNSNVTDSSEIPFEEEEEKDPSLITYTADRDRNQFSPEDINDEFSLLSNDGKQPKYSLWDMFEDVSRYAAMRSFYTPTEYSNANYNNGEHDDNNSKKRKEENHREHEDFDVSIHNDTESILVPYFVEKKDFPNATDTVYANLLQLTSVARYQRKNNITLKYLLPDAVFKFNEYSADQKSHSYKFDVGVMYNNNIFYQRDVIGNVFQTMSFIRARSIALIESAFVRQVTNKIVPIGLQALPYMASTPQINVMNVIGIALFPFALSFLMPVYLFTIVMEKENRLTEMMKMMGMRMRTYWIVTYIFDYLLYSLVCIVFIAAELIYQVRFFTQSSPLLIFLLFFLWGHCQIAMSFFLSAFFNKARAATVFGYLLVIISVIAAEAFNGQVYQDQTPPWWYWIYPPFAFYRCIYIMFMACYNLDCLGVDAISSWHADASLSFLAMAVQTVVLLVLTYYFNAVFPSEYGLKKHPLFFLSPLYPLYRRIRYRVRNKNGGGDDDDDDDDDNNGDKSLLDHHVDVEQNELEEDEDVVAEKDRVLHHDVPEDAPLIIRRLVKHYSRGFRSSPKRAVDGVSFAAHRNECFGLLGPNGAGKSTTISMLTGLFPATSGSASIGGFDMNEEMHRIHRIIGVCPQFDVLWEELSIREHLLFYARLKGIPPAEERQHVDSVIDQVGLLDVKKRAAKKLSGGMKRRLSLGISLIGEPEVVFLDEPTTGLDPESRRSVWDAISQAQTGRCMVLTTHSMEEADCLCSRIAIMGDGRLKCIGTQVHLKHKFGRGYKLSISFDENNQEKAQKFVYEHVPSAEVEQIYPGMIEYRVPAANVTLSDIFEKFEDGKDDHGIIEWGIAQGSLEQVFLRIVGGDQSL